MQGTTYHQLHVFHHIVQQGSIRGAARALGMTSPSVSQALRLLETNIGLTLFHRTTRKVELTDAGRQLYERTQGAMTSLNYALESVAELAQVPSGLLRITLPKFVYQAYFKAIYPLFCQQYPQITLEVVLSDATLDIVKEGIDLGIRFGNKLEPDMVAKPLTEPLPEALFASPEYLARMGEPKTIDDLQRHQMIQYRFITSNQFAQIRLMDGGQPVQITMQHTLIVNDTDAMLDAAEAGLGIGGLVLSAAQLRIDQGKLCPVLPQLWAHAPGLYLYFSQHSQKVKRVRVLIDFLMTHFASGQHNQI
ncbi:HTH-type transcriptional regulator PgrR [Vibrio stylophorae]|uniref:HTH-type transcriptional regulator PgrR n=1 Tax=Vibrio stylophorae TaxID=659351 RepID=A0ABM8ZTH3_9VIBR|nr:LysR family transcriptional regulator [Vibrio stylophorae]CAH0533594.1 HTH-type transcriptional regulator PgrR [Vibrio stylophorae]